MKEIKILEQIQALHIEIYKECSYKLKIYDWCLKHGKECNKCRLKKDCEIDFTKLIELNNLYRKLELLN